MGQGMMLTRGARNLGGVLCAVLAAVTAAAVVRDAVDVGALDLLRGWSGAGTAGFAAGPTTSLLDGQLLVVYLAGLFVSRTGAAGAYLATAAALTLLLRAAALWSLLADRSPGVLWRTDPGRWAFLTLSGALAASLVLLLTVLAGRKLAAGGFGLDTSNRVRPAAPRFALAAFAFLLLASAAGVLAAWQVWWIVEHGWNVYERLLTGGRGAVLAIGRPPPAFQAWTVCLLLLVTAFMAVFRSPASRPAGMTGAWLLLSGGAAQLALLLDRQVFLEFQGLPVAAVLDQLTVVFQIVVGLAVMALLAPGDPQDSPWGPGFGAPLSGYGAPGGRGRPGGPGGYTPPPPSGRPW